MIFVGEQLYSELEAPVMNGICSDAIADGSVTSITNPYYDISITKKKGILIFKSMNITLCDIVQVIH